MSTEYVNMKHFIQQQPDKQKKSPVTKGANKDYTQANNADKKLQH